MDIKCVRKKVFRKKILAKLISGKEAMKLQDYRPVKGFDGYTVTDQGWVSRDMTGRVLTRSTNREGVLNVALWGGDGNQKRRSVAHLVAEAFLEPPPNEHFDSIIHLDGNRENCAAANLAWRPRWFTIRYHRQFSSPLFVNWNEPIVLMQTHEMFHRAAEAAMAYGLLVVDIYNSVNDGSLCFPQQFNFQFSV